MLMSFLCTGIRWLLPVIVVMPLLGGCAGGLANVATTPATLAQPTEGHEELVRLPPPKGKIRVAVYNFRDQTGQYKPIPGVTSFSTAVTQGATSMLVQALKDSQWFIPIEREGLQNLLTERKIIRAALKKDEDTEVALPPLDVAQVLLEGGVVAFDTNLVTGGFGAKYFGAGGFVEYRVDQVRIYLRAVDVRSGQVLKSVSTTKSVLSREVDAGIFRYVSYKRLLEVETGLTTNEPAQMAVLGAIEKAVTALVIEGIIDRTWALKNPGDLESSQVIRNYLEEKGLHISPLPAS